MFDGTVWDGCYIVSCIIGMGPLNGLRGNPITRRRRRRRQRRWGSRDGLYSSFFRRWHQNMHPVWLPNLRFALFVLWILLSHFFFFFFFFFFLSSSLCGAVIVHSWA
ncbi:uncharacterized protein K489DRAFT_187860 [Dissoconium aciculare CBS 342.82]|uniref:Uncharacterized protein n=1 Tax=Dissoconium aciculare CBS 342.82 TaxID=1314786 RepID=A0A6J3MA14_9PEZI|nr:uncharacterized protein K489DRAFT_187860 [Dissoconium aciculare CBS 342.82]KAF1824688.1 hypothetical protein K489DRAFT_187860 [Dissoconium aciculare CBS 342.82]